MLASVTRPMGFVMSKFLFLLLGDNEKQELLLWQVFMFHVPPCFLSWGCLCAAVVHLSLLRHTDDTASWRVASYLPCFISPFYSDNVSFVCVCCQAITFVGVHLCHVNVQDNGFSRPCYQRVWVDADRMAALTCKRQLFHILSHLNKRQNVLLGFYWMRPIWSSAELRVGKLNVIFNLNSIRGQQFAIRGNGF